LNIFEMVIGIVFFSIVAGVIKHYIDARSDEARKERDGNATRTTDLEGTVRSLEERVRVLERIITSDGYDLKRKFDDLEREQRQGEG